jgi:hypothetical protein
MSNFAKGSSNGQFWYGGNTFPGFLYKKVGGGGVRRSTLFNPGGNVVCNSPTYIYNKYNPGQGGIGASTTSNRRAKNRYATVCTTGCFPCYMQLGLYTINTNPNGYYPCPSPNPIKCSLKDWQLTDLGSDTNSYNWERVAMSYDGRIRTAVIRGGNIYNSFDYGNTWKPSPQNFNLNWFSITMSKDGKYQTAAPQGGFLYNSYDYGNTWLQNQSAPSAWWISVCMSENGQHQTAIINGYYTSELNGFIYTSNDYGVNWNIQFNENNCWIYVAMSNDGKYQTAVSFLIDGIYDSADVMGYVFQSNDYGVTWNKNNNLPKSYYTCVSLSQSGRNQIIGVNNCNYAPATTGPLLISYDYGLTFNNANCPLDNWIDISMQNNSAIILASGYQQTNSDGSIVPDTGKMMVSYNYGVYWQQTSALLSTWTSTTVARQSCQASATAFGNGIFIAPI